MSEALIKVEGISKKFCRSLKRSLWYGMQDLGAELMGRRHGGQGELRRDEFWAVKDVNFEVKRGECLGLIGPNGAGKSTLLKMLNGLIKPDQGRIEIRGRVGALIELGAGFNPVLSGRENIYVNGSVLGFTKAEIDRKLDEIIDFSELEEFIDAPVQSYSSGMRVRLGFAVAAQMEPDVLLLDEVLAVGDVGFRAKCYNYMAQINKNASVVFVSHAMTSVGRICSRAILLNSSEVLYDGETSLGIQKYYSLFDNDKTAVTGSGSATVYKFIFKNNNGEVVDTIGYGNSLSTEIQLSVSEHIKNPVIYLCFHDQEMRVVAELNSRNDMFIIENNGEMININVSIDSFILNPGRYKVSCCVYCDKMQEHCSWHYCYFSINVSGNFHGTAPVQFKANWTVSDHK